MFRALSDWLDEPVLVLRLEIVRIAAPLAVLGFMSGRLAHADEWIGDAGFRVPDLGGGDYRQPLYVPALPSTLAWALALTMVVAGLACALGYKTRTSALVFAGTLAFVALSDRLAAFTVSKLSPAVMLGIAAGPAGTRLGLDAWLAGRRGVPAPEAMRPMGSVRFLQLLLVTIYSASGIAKYLGDWHTKPLVLWSHLHDSYQTGFSFFLASILPGWSWTLMQGLVLAFEMLSPLWFGLARTRTYAFVFGLGMHTMIGLCFGPVVWFALLMMTLLVGGYLPERFLEPLERVAGRLEAPRESKSTSTQNAKKARQQPQS
jgi:uncharacterized membrane protein YphA (DoxX/SURF4 family)